MIKTGHFLPGHHHDPAGALRMLRRCTAAFLLVALAALGIAAALLGGMA